MRTQLKLIITSLLSALLITFTPNVENVENLKVNINFKQEDALSFLAALPRVNDAIALNQLRMIPGGETHNIYIYDQNPNFLLKVIKKSIGNNLETLNSNLNKLKQSYDDLYAAFELEKCLVEQRFINLIQEPGRCDPAYAIVSVVRFEPAFQNKEKFGLNFGAIEQDEIKINEYPSKYHSLNLGLMGSKLSYKDFNLEIFLQFEPSFDDVFKKIDQNKPLQNALKDFLIKVKLYYKKTDRFLDLRGKDNVIFYATEKGWDYRVGSVIKHETGTDFKRMISEISNNPESINLSFENWTMIFYVPSWIRGLNALAKKLKMNKIIEEPIISAEDSISLAKAHLYLTLPRRAVYYAENNRFKEALKFFNEFKKTENTYSTRLRERLGVAYWKYTQRKNIAQLSKKEMELFLILLIDPRNKFSSHRYEVVQSSIEGLLYRLGQFGPINPIIKGKAKTMLALLKFK
jgi:hypothetical protein